VNFDVAYVHFIGQSSFCLLKIKLFVNTRDFRVSQQCIWELHSSGILRSVEW